MTFVLLPSAESLALKANKEKAFNALHDLHLCLNINTGLYKVRQSVLYYLKGDSIAIAVARGTSRTTRPELVNPTQNVVSAVIDATHAMQMAEKRMLLGQHLLNSREVGVAVERYFRPAYSDVVNAARSIGTVAAHEVAKAGKKEKSTEEIERKIGKAEDELRRISESMPEHLRFVPEVPKEFALELR